MKKQKKVRIHAYINGPYKVMLHEIASTQYGSNMSAALEVAIVLLHRAVFFFKRDPDKGDTKLWKQIRNRVLTAKELLE